MRIISGTSRGRRLFAPGRGAGVSTIRPTSDRVREAVFNILGQSATGVEILDLFAGTGALGLESLSRGSRKAVFVDASPDAIKLIKRNLDICGFSDRSTVIKRDLLQGPFFLQKIKPARGFDLVFADPPYRLGISIKVLKYLGKLDLLSKDGLLVVEEASEVDLPDEITGLKKIDRRVYGDTSVCFYRNNTDEIPI